MEIFLILYECCRRQLGNLVYFVQDFPYRSMNGELRPYRSSRLGFIDDHKVLPPEIIDKTCCRIDHKRGPADNQRIRLRNRRNAVLYRLTV